MTENQKISDQEPETAAGCYFHIPFCSHKCDYCHFLSFPFDEKTCERYVNAVLMELRHFAAQFQAMPRVDSIYFGGGTPGLIPADNIAGILNECRRLFPIAAESEITLETNPGIVSPEKAAAYIAAGVNRVSLGAQSFSDAELRAVGRIHSAAQIAESLATLSSAGFYNISLDLILGLPGQSAQSWRETLGLSVSFQVRHISVYMLDMDEQSPLSARVSEEKQFIPEEDLVADLYAETIDFLGSQGFDQYEISNFAHAKSASRHNMKYWRRTPVYGFGLGSHSFDGFFRYANVSEIGDYCRLVESNMRPLAWRSEVTAKQALEETFFLGLRLVDGVDLRNAAVVGFLAEREKEMEEFRARGLINLDGSRLRLSRKGMLLSNEVLEMFI